MRYICILFLFIHSLAFSQSITYEIEFYNIPLDEAFKQVEQKFDIKFSFDPVKLHQYNISGTIQAESKKELVEKLIKNVPFKFKRAQNIYLIIPDENKKSKSYLRGQVYDAEHGYPLAFATIQTSEEDGVIASPGGDFKLALPYDSVLLTVSYLGYKPKKVWAKPNQDLLIIRMETDSKELPEFIIGANQGFEELRSGSFSIDPNQISTLPSLGETDIFKSLQLLPGIRGTDESSAGLVVRGSSPDQNLVLLDGFTLYHLDHFFGIFSTFNPRTINNVKIYKGGFESKYGGRISSVIDASAKGGGFDRLRGGVGLTSTSFNGYLETPIGNRSSLIVGYRRSYYDLLQNSIYKTFIDKNRIDILDATGPGLTDDELELEPDFRFFDFNVKYRFQADPDEYWDINLYLSQDEYTGTKTQVSDSSSLSILDKAKWSNLGFSYNWRRNWSEKSFSNLAFSLSNYTGNSNLESTQTFNFPVDLSNVNFTQLNDSTISLYNFFKENSITDFSIKWYQEYNLAEKSTFIFGAELNTLATTYNIQLDGFTGAFDENGSIASLFVEHKYHGERFNLNTGLRYSGYANTQTSLFAPRLNASFKLTRDFAVHGTWSKHNQFINRISISPFGNSDQFYWVLADEVNYPVMHSTHLMGGVKFQKNKWTIDLEAYQKDSEGLVESEYALFSPYNESSISDIEDVIFTGTNLARGVDLFIKRKSKKLTTWLSYTYAISENNVPLLNNGFPYPSDFDQRHEVNLSNIFKVGKWEFSSVFIYGSGTPYTPPGEISATRQILFDIQQLNAKRLPAYHRLDLSGKYKTKLRSINVEAGLTLFNIYNRTNIRSRRYGLRTNYDASEGRITSLTAFPIDVTLLGFTPNLFVNFNF